MAFSLLSGLPLERTRACVFLGVPDASIVSELLARGVCVAVAHAVPETFEYLLRSIAKGHPPVASPLALPATSPSMLRAHCLQLFASSPWAFFLQGLSIVAVDINAGIAQPSRPPAKAAQINNFAEAISAARDFILLSFGNSCADQQLGTHNALRNARLVAESYGLSDLSNRGSGRMGLLIASGPSLDLVLPALPAFIASRRPNIYVLACDSALKALTKVGIVPDAVASLERTPLIPILLSNGLVPPDALFVSVPYQDPAVFSHVRGPKVFALPNNRLLEHLFGGADNTNTYVGPAVSTLGIRALLTLGCDPIVLVGNDLAFHPNTGATHTAAMVLGQESLQHERPPAEIIWSQANNGGVIATLPKWEYFRSATEYLIAQHPERRWYNAIPEAFGARIEGAKRVDLERISISAASEAGALRLPAKEHRYGETTQKISAARGLLVEWRQQLLEASKGNDFAALEQTIARFTNETPMFSTLLGDVIAPLHIATFNRFFVLPEDRHDERLALLHQWLREAAELAEWLAGELAHHGV